MNEETTTLRSEGWEIAFGKILNRPIFGNGLGRLHNMKDHNGLGVHNVYLILWGESGIIPFLLLLVMIFYFFFKGHFIFRDPGLSFLITGFLLVMAVHLYGSGQTGLRNQEANGILGFLIALTSFKKLEI